MTVVIEVVLVALLAPAVGASLYLFALTVASLRRDVRRVTLSAQAKGLRFDFLVPAHNEEETIATTVQSLKAVDWPEEQRRIVVVADNCSDRTAERAAQAGAHVLVRREPERRGKGFALEFGLGRCVKDGFADAVVVVDADTVVRRDFLDGFADRLSRGALAVQALSGVHNASDSWRTRLMAVALSTFNDVRSTGRDALGLSTGLRGNGMCLSRHALLLRPYNAFSLAEDVEYGLELGRSGIAVVSAAPSRVESQMVRSGRNAAVQRARWEGGRRALRRTHALKLLRDGLLAPSARLLDLAIDLLVPPLATIAIWLAAVLAVSIVVGSGMGAFFAGAGLAMLATYVLRGWSLSRTGAPGLVALFTAPAYVAWKLWAKARTRTIHSWERTAREPALETSESL
jgi:1,2-diacylglycerol 3-beta-glucosyltransferase